MVTRVDDDNAELLRRAGDGDQQAWNTIVDRHNGLLWSVARSFRLGHAEAADAVQNTWLRLVEHLDRVTEPDRLASWLGTTVRRECLQLLRRTARQHTSAFPELLVEIADPGPPLDAGLLLAERDAALWRAFETLPARCRQLLRVLMASPPPAYAEVAAALDMPIGSIGPTRQRCLAQLRATVSAAPALADHVPTTEDRS
ncbi:sigma-70 family RNA polymerase sigma factor [Micromonospora sp. WMMD1082]|uniref:RNA polymerase sigma factor n=1 Tax=Micromonospora sp. WMMD1082 TaxID=3016104 RepID=UPI002417B94B|nr:sigma-70 family RNA polymerase sigma factor [Micromonospora sp. WMMD1082]MDG4798154.1 sigma-70 family RNA polymerase sigma factor [Micromonospora sp. WMMD1082]